MKFPNEFLVGMTAIYFETFSRSFVFFVYNIISM
jgi:hypothetical protein